MSTIVNKIDTDFAKATKSYIADAEQIVIVAHKNPDGDAVGSSLGLYHLLKKMEKKVTIVVPNMLPTYLSWLSGFSDIVEYETSKDIGLKVVKESDLVIMLDFNHNSRLSELGNIIFNAQKKSILIDHHPEPQEIADFVYSRVSASSTSEMVYEFIEKVLNKELIDKNIAECLYTGIMTDTGSFNYNSSTPDTFNIVAELLKLGINKDYITDKVFNNFSESRLRFLGYAVNTKMKVIPKYKSAYIYLTKKDLKDYNFQKGDTEGFVNYPLSIGNVIFTAIFIESDGIVKCSFRSKGNFPANLVAQENFNGGGHTNAAGGESKESILETIRKFETILPKYELYVSSYKIDY